MNESYYYVINGKRHGPVPFTSLRELATRAELKRSDLVWCRGMKTWESASSVERLFEDLPPDLGPKSDQTPPPMPPEAEVSQEPLSRLQAPGVQSLWNGLSKENRLLIAATIAAVG